MVPTYTIRHSSDLSRGHFYIWSITRPALVLPSRRMVRSTSALTDRALLAGVCCSGLLEYGVSVAGDSERMSGQAAPATPRPAPVGLATVLRATVQPGGLSDSTYILPGHTGHNCCLKYQTGHLTVLSSTLYMGQASTT